MINLRFPSKLSALIQAARLPKIASFICCASSRWNVLTRFIAPLLVANSYTCLLFIIIEVSRLQVVFLTDGLSWEKIKHKSSDMPPIRHRFRLFLGWSSARSVSSSRRLTTSSSDGRFACADSFSLSGCALLDHSFSLLISSVSLSVSLNVCAFIAASSHYLSSWDIALNSDGLVPS